MSAQARTAWDDRAHLVLLQAIIAMVPLSPGQWEKVIEQVQGHGYNYTASAAVYAPVLSKHPHIT